MGVDIYQDDVADTFESAVWEPSIVKSNALTAAAEAACLILSIDETVKAPTSRVADAAAQHGGHPMAGRGRGMPRR